MDQAQYGIMRFAKYKGPEIGNIEAHNERTKEKYASNPDVDVSRSKYNFHLVKPVQRLLGLALCWVLKIGKQRIQIDKSAVSHPDRNRRNSAGVHQMTNKFK